MLCLDEEQESLELMKIKEWPIVVSCSLQYWCRTGGWLTNLPFYSLDQLKCREDVKMNDTERNVINAITMSKGPSSLR
jgi:hypothetical protein